MDPQRQQLIESLTESMPLLGIGLVIALLLIAFGFHWIRSWYRDRDDPADLTDELLNQMRELHLEGDLSDEEFRSIQSQFSSRKETQL